MAQLRLFQPFLGLVQLWMAQLRPLLAQLRLVKPFLFLVKLWLAQLRRLLDQLLRVKPFLFLAQLWLAQPRRILAQSRLIRRDGIRRRSTNNVFGQRILAVYANLRSQFYLNTSSYSHYGGPLSFTSRPGYATPNPGYENSRLSVFPQGLGLKAKPLLQTLGFKTWPWAWLIC